MISRLRNSIFTKILWGLMGLYLLNISVDTADPNPEYIPEDLSFNDQESIVEIIIEKVLGFEDAIKEYDDHDTADHNKKKNVKIDLLVYTAKTNNYSHNQLIERKKFYPYYEARLINGFLEIASPPPKV
ncbi:MAG: hypothetical protein MI975_14040 [Cytophagales bacterium]|nr:hypothetical protein [Cytophagales bacterium]